MFLGFTIRRLRKCVTQKYYVYTMPSRKGRPGQGQRIGETYRSTRHKDLNEVPKATFDAVDHHVRGRLMRWTRTKYKGWTGLSSKNTRRRFCDCG